MTIEALEKRLFEIHNSLDFEELSLDVFRFQYQNNPIYRQFAEALNRTPQSVNNLKEIPFLPIEFFKSHKIQSTTRPAQAVFTSSGTTGSATSKHYVPSLELYEKTFLNAFEKFYSPVEDYVVLGLLPSYLERQGSSLIVMVDAFIKRSHSSESGFYLNDLEALTEKLKRLDSAGKKILLIGVSFALLDLIEREQFNLKNTVIMETGGMKGRRKEITRFELHEHLKRGFGVEKIHSEYGMTELLSQAYSQGKGIFSCPETMQILIREPEDALSYQPEGRTGGLNIVDLANLYSCAFIATQDLGKKLKNNRFQVLGRFDHSDIRGCNLMVF